MLLFVLACISADPKGRFVDDYQSEVRELRREFAEARGIATVRSTLDGKPGPSAAFRFATGFGRRKVEFDRTVRMSSGKDSVNSYGYAELDGRNIEVHRTGPSERYAVIGIGDDDPTRRAVFNMVFGNYLNAAWGFGGYDIDYAVGRGWLSVTEAREVEEPGRDLVEVTFRQTTSKEPSYYRAAFDPMLHWAITRASRWKEDPSKPSERYIATYGPAASGRPYIKTLHWWGLDGTEKFCEFEQVEFTPTAASEFTLEHYGLKSPPLPNAGPNYKLLITILALAVILLLAAWLTRRIAMRR